MHTQRRMRRSIRADRLPGRNRPRRAPERRRLLPDISRRNQSPDPRRESGAKYQSGCYLAANTAETGPISVIAGGRPCHSLQGLIFDSPPGPTPRPPPRAPCAGHYETPQLHRRGNDGQLRGL